MMKRFSEKKAIEEVMGTGNEADYYIMYRLLKKLKKSIYPLKNMRVDKSNFDFIVNLVCIINREYGSNKEHRLIKLIDKMSNLAYKNPRITEDFDKDTICIIISNFDKYENMMIMDILRNLAEEKYYKKYIECYERYLNFLSLLKMQKNNNDESLFYDYIIIINMIMIMIMYRYGDQIEKINK